MVPKFTAMAVKRKPDIDVILLVLNKEDLKGKIECRIKVGLDISELAVTNEQENQEMWDRFIDWNEINEEIIRQAFDRPKNIYVEEYKYKPGIGIGFFAGNRRQKSFQEIVEENRSAIRYQIRKLNWFYEKIDLLPSSDSALRSERPKDYLKDLILLLNRFHKSAQALRDRHSNRETIMIKDEYDVQDLLYSLLQIYFDDIRKEDASPSHAGANSRIDFVLKKEKIVLEVKMTNESLSTNKLGQELLIDIGRYKEYPECKDLVIFIYDKGDFIRNKNGLITDLQKHATNDFKVTVVINPL